MPLAAPLVATDEERLLFDGVVGFCRSEEEEEAAHRRRRAYSSQCTEVCASVRPLYGVSGAAALEGPEASFRNGCDEFLNSTPSNIPV